LKGFTGVETVSRDGSGTYKKAFNDAFPKAEQISDRFHLVKNLVEAAQRYFTKIIPFSIVPPRKGANKLGIRGKMNAVERGILERHEIKLKVFRRVKRLQAKCKSVPAVSRELGLTEKMVEKYFRLDNLPLHGRAMEERASKFQPFKPLVIDLIKRIHGFAGMSARYGATARTTRKTSFTAAMYASCCTARRKKSVTNGYGQRS
jgi:hypothetical protein